MMVTVPVTTELLPASTTISAGTELSLPCNVDGNPEPIVTWSKDGVALTPTDTMWITGKMRSVLYILNRIRIGASFKVG